MKKLQSLQALAVAGVAITFMATGCSSTSSNRADTGSTESGALSAYRMSSAFGSVPITESRMMNKFPLEWGPVSYESYTFRVPACGVDAANPSVATASQTTVSTSTASTSTSTTTSTGAPGETTVTTVTSPGETTVVHTDTDIETHAFNTGLQPGDTFVEAAGADGVPVVKRVIRYTPFGGGGSSGQGGGGAGR